jgi:hypothetical protein
MRFALRNSIVRNAPPTDEVEAVNVKDKHVAMVAITAQATIAVTNDRRLRRQLSDALPKLSTLSVDQFALRLFEREPESLGEILDTMAAKRTRPPMGTDELVPRLAGTLPKFAAKWRQSR